MTSLHHPPPPDGLAPAVIRFSCWSCNTELTVPAHLAGVTGPCPRCAQTLAAPVAPPSFLSEASPYTSETANPVPSSSSASSAGSGYRRPEPPPHRPPPKAAGQQRSTSDHLLVHTGLLGILLARTAGAVNRNLFSGIENLIVRRILCWSVYIIAISLYFTIGSGLSRWAGPRQSSVVSNNGHGTRAQQLATARYSIKSQAHGQFTDADFAAADAAASDPSVSEQRVLDVYMQTLQSRIYQRAR